MHRDLPHLPIESSGILEDTRKQPKSKETRPNSWKYVIKVIEIDTLWLYRGTLQRNARTGWQIQFKNVSLFKQEKGHYSVTYRIS